MTERRLGLIARRLPLVLIVVSLCGIAVVPLLRGTSPCTHDGGLHYFRTVALRYAVEHGIVFSRWMPDLAFGYGFPFFNYRAPLSYYLGLGLYLLGLPLPWALNLLYALSIVGSALGAYLLARDLFGPLPGVVAAVAYAYAPYQLLDALVRGNAPESVALALMPFILWAFRRLMLRSGRRWFLVSVAALSLLYLGHNISSLLFTPFLLAYLAVLWFIYRGRAAWKPTGLAFVLALALTAFFWFPALAEKEYVQLYLTGATRNNDFHHNFVGLAEVFALSKPFDTSLMNPPLEVRLGAVPSLLGGIGFVVGMVLPTKHEGSGYSPDSQEAERGGHGAEKSRKLREQRGSLLFFAGTAVLFVFMSTPASVWLWETMPLLPFVQFPWRFVGRAALPVALLAGAVLLPLQNRLTRRWTDGERLGSVAFGLLPSALVIALILVALPSSYPATGYCPTKRYPTIRDVHYYERASGLVGVDPVGAYFPVWVEQRPQASPLEAQYAENERVERFDAGVLPDGARVLDAEYGPNQAQIVVDSPQAFHARYRTFYFPGWRAFVDGERVEVRPTDKKGLLMFEVPAGRHVVSVSFGETRVRLAADGVSVLALLALIGVSASSIVAPGDAVSMAASSLGSTERPEVRLSLLVTAVALLLFKLAVVDQMRTPFRHPALTEEGRLPSVTHPLYEQYADGLTLIGYELGVDGPARQMPADDALLVDLYWTVRQKPSQRYQSVVHLVGPQGLRWSTKDSFRPTDYQGSPPTTVWEPGRYAVDSHEVEPSPGTPPGRYDVVLTVFDRETLAPLSVLSEEGQPVAPDLTLGQVTLTPPRRAVDTERLAIGHRIDARFGPLTLLGIDFDRDETAPGESVFVTSFWRADQQLDEDRKLRLALVGPDGSPVAEYVRSPVAPWHPTSDWQAADVWRGQHRVQLPADLKTAAYTWTVSLSDTSASPVAVSPVSVTAPRRTFAQPSVDVKINEPLGEVATLVGADISPEAEQADPGTSLTITLFWRAAGKTATSYRVFLHLTGPDGALLHQSDGVPVDWTRPTTGWVDGEIIRDKRVLAVPVDAPPGDYTIYAGLYTPQGGRLLTPDGADAVRVKTVSVGGQP